MPTVFSIVITNMGKIVRRRTTNEISKRLGSRIRLIRQRRGWSLEGLSQRIGMHVTYLSSVERGHRNPTLNVIAAIAKGLEVSLSHLVSRIDEREEPCEVEE